MLRSVVDFTQDDWDEHLPAAELAFNNSKNETTGFTPFYLVYGREARMPIDVALAPLTKAADNPTAAEATARWRAALQQASENTAQQQRRQKTYADRARRDVRFAIGDRVLLSTEHLKLIGERRRTRKLTERFVGPYRVKRVVNANAYELDLPASLKIHPVVNISQLKEYRDGVQAFPDRPVRITRPEPEAVDDNGAPEWRVDRLLDHRIFPAELQAAAGEEARRPGRGVRFRRCGRVFRGCARARAARLPVPGDRHRAARRQA
jgi:hypothetical protein